MYRREERARGRQEQSLPMINQPSCFEGKYQCRAYRTYIYIYIYIDLAPNRRASASLVSSPQWPPVTNTLLVPVWRVGIQCAYGVRHCRTLTNQHPTYLYALIGIRPPTRPAPLLSAWARMKAIESRPRPPSPAYFPSARKRRRTADRRQLVEVLRRRGRSRDRNRSGGKHTASLSRPASRSTVCARTSPWEADHK